MMKKMSARCVAILLLCGALLVTGCSGPNDDGTATTTTTTSTSSSGDGTVTTTTGEDITGTSTSVDGNTTTTAVGAVTTTTVNQTTTTMAAGTPVADKGLVRIGFADSVGAIEVDKEAKQITIPVRGDADLTGKLPVTQASAGYTVTLTNGADLNSDLTYTVSNGKTTEQWVVTTEEDYTGLEKADQLSVMSVFKTGAVLQRDEPVSVWGFCEGADMVSVEFAGQKKRSAVVNGRWEVTLDPMPANSTGQTLLVTTAGRSVNSTNVLVGDVWFCSGQSNMDWNAKTSQEIASLAYLSTADKIRCFDIPDLWNTEPRTTFASSAAWRPASNYVTRNLSMYALAFAYRLQQELDVPIGVIVASSGGTLIEHWLPDDSLIAAGTSRDTEQTGEGCRQGVGNGMYNAMVYPLKGLTVKGILWYQGEANVNATSDYVRLFKEYTVCYRKLFDDPALPIIATQLPIFDVTGYETWKNFRLIQHEAVSAVENAYLVCGIDLGEIYNIHPACKHEHGSRAAELVLNKVYGQSTPGESAYPTTVTQNGNTVTIRFKNAESGLTLSEGSVVRELYGVTAGGSKVTPSSVTVKGDTLTMTVNETIVRVDYAMSNVPDVNLYTGNGLPVAPFSWKLS